MKPLDQKEKILLSQFLTAKDKTNSQSFGSFVLEHPAGGLCYASRVRKSLPDKVQHLFYKDKYDSRLYHCLEELT